MLRKIRKSPEKPALIISLILLTAVFAASCNSSGKPPETAAKEAKDPKAAATPDQRQPRAVKVSKSIERNVVQTVTATGTLAAEQVASLSFKVAGRLASLSIDLGSNVSKGQEVAKLETIDFKQRIDQAEAALQQARVRLGLAPTGPAAEELRLKVENTAIVRQASAVLEEARQNRARTMQLVAQGVQSPAELDRVESAFKVAEGRYQDAIEEARNRQGVLVQRRSELELAQQQLQYTSLAIPFTGSISERKTSVGEYLAIGTPVATLVQINPLRLRVEVPERESFGIKPGLSVRVTLEGDSNTYSGKVTRLSPTFVEQSRSLVIEAEVNNSGGKLRPGAFAKAEIQTTATKNIVTVPNSAVVVFAGIQKVFIAKEGKAIERLVTVGRKEADWLEITEGLKAGEDVINNPGTLVGGQPIIVQ